MNTWQVIIGTCAGMVTILTVFEKLGITNRLKRADTDLNEIKKIVKNISELTAHQQELITLQKDQNNALLALLRNDLYQSFKINRDLGVWTDDEANVQTKLHIAYRALHGNGEEELWWEKKKSWRIVSNEEYNEFVSKCK